MQEVVKELNTIEELKKAISESDEQPVLLFKHSLTCPISTRAFSEFNSHLESPVPNVRYKLIVVQTAGPVSDAAAATLGISHQSPQAILVRNGRGIWNASHFEITATALREAIEGASPAAS